MVVLTWFYGVDEPGRLVKEPACVWDVYLASVGLACLFQQEIKSDSDTHEEELQFPFVLLLLVSFLLFLHLSFDPGTGVRLEG